MDDQHTTTQPHPAADAQPAEASTAADAQPAEASTTTYGWGVGVDPQEVMARYLEKYGAWFHDQEGREADRKAMREVVADWEREHGPLTPEGRAKARAILGL